MNTKVLLVAALLALAVSQLASAACHNATGSCTQDSFVCANGEAIAHSKRCDGVEDCADGTDEYLCDQSAKPFDQLTVAERTAITEVACIKCTCLKGTVVVSAGAWLQIGLKAPRGWTLMTDSPATPVFNKACHPTQTTQVTLEVYKKQNKGCRGWVCCFRQKSCDTCSGGMLPARHCWNNV